MIDNLSADRPGCSFEEFSGSIWKGSELSALVGEISCKLQSLANCSCRIECARCKVVTFLSNLINNGHNLAVYWVSVCISLTADNDSSDDDCSAEFPCEVPSPISYSIQMCTDYSKQSYPHALTLLDPDLSPVKQRDMTDSWDGSSHELSASDSWDADLAETSILADETFADEDWEGDSSDDADGGDDDDDGQQVDTCKESNFDMPATGSEPGSLSSNDTLPSQDEDKLLYPGAPITLGTSILLLLTFAMSHSLSSEALSHLLELIEAHCIVPNLCATSITKLKSFFRQLKTPLYYHYYCPFCYGLLEGGPDTEECPYCGLSLKQEGTLEKSFFIEIPIEQQLVDCFSSKYTNKDCNTVKGLNCDHSHKQTA